MYRLGLTVVAALVACLLVATATAGCGGSTGSTASSPSARPSPNTSPSTIATAASLLVVRKVGRTDTVWHLDPATGQAVGVGRLHGVAAQAEASPDGAVVAYLPAPEKQGPRVWLSYGSGAPRAVSLASAGLKYLDSATWLSPTRLLLCGATSGGAYYSGADRNDRFYVLSTTSGRVRPFRDLRGVDPSAGSRAGKLAFVTFTHPGLYLGVKGEQGINENLMLLDLRKKQAATLVISQQIYVGMMRMFNSPELAPSGKYVLTVQTGTDTGVTYSVCDALGGSVGLTISSDCPAPCAAWNAGGTKVGFWGMGTVLDDESARVWVYDTESGELSRSRSLGNAWIDGLAWSPSGDLAVGVSTFSTHPHPTIIVAPGGDVHHLTTVGQGSLPVWVK